MPPWPPCRRDCGRSTRIRRKPQPKADPIGHKDRKKSLGFGRNRPCAYRRDAAYSIYLGFFVLFVAIDSSRISSIFEDSDPDWRIDNPCSSAKTVVSDFVSKDEDIVTAQHPTNSSSR